MVMVVGVISNMALYNPVGSYLCVSVLVIQVT